MSFDQIMTLSYILMVGIFLCLVVQDFIRYLKSLIHTKSKQLPKTIEDPTFTEYMDEKYMNRTDTDNIFPVGISDEEFRKFTIKYLLGDNWYVSDPLGRTQINEVALTAILEEYSKDYQKECNIGRGK